MKAALRGEAPVPAWFLEGRMSEAERMAALERADYEGA
jgi:hypothetical protein